MFPQKLLALFRPLVRLFYYYYEDTFYDIPLGPEFNLEKFCFVTTLNADFDLGLWGPPYEWES